MIILRSFFLAGLAMFFAAQQALCACEAPRAPAPVAMEMAHSMPAGHACDETKAPHHDKSACPHCNADHDLIAKAPQAMATPLLPVSTAPALFLPSEAFRVSAPPMRPPKYMLYQASGPPRLTPLQLKTRFLN
ncbi:hypothetical protein [Hyphomonas jannaschiana]|uniref:Lipoprotein n=1 Tax=Hyphomonas jannaschiana VP2 TaxID=1280952 RepID=A0A059FEL7_9PROT|nr:hypothetical protein [Hyphomonas jannaschiana]KCZ89027.1 hypothetical protein HJA_07017 [Hyphomonas jannaschiana VP2]